MQSKDADSKGVVCKTTLPVCPWRQLVADLVQMAATVERGQGNVKKSA